MPARDERVVDSIFAGCIDNLPPLSSKVVRIFTSSTFTDMLMERNTLMEWVYPKIKEYCREKHGLEFQVVDMRWGVRDEMTNEHMTTVGPHLPSLAHQGALHERAARLPKVQHGAQLHLLWGPEIRL